VTSPDPFILSSSAFSPSLEQSLACRARYRASHNIGPGSRLPIFRVPPVPSATSAPTADDPIDAALAVQLESARWGLIPSFTPPASRPDFFRMFNARCESVTTKPVFSRLLKQRNARCVICIEGFYEWKVEFKVRQPYYVCLTGRPMLLAGLRDTWKGGEGEEGDMHSCTMLTTRACRHLTWLHDRMPVVLPTVAAVARWLCAPADDLADLFEPYEGAGLTWHAVNPAMNKASYQGKDCASPLKVAKVSSFFLRSRTPAQWVGTAAGPLQIPVGGIGSGSGMKSETEAADEKVHGCLPVSKGLAVKGEASETHRGEVGDNAGLAARDGSLVKAEDVACNVTGLPGAAAVATSADMPPRHIAAGSQERPQGSVDPEGQPMGPEMGEHKREWSCEIRGTGLQDIPRRGPHSKRSHTAVQTGRFHQAGTGKRSVQAGRAAQGSQSLLSFFTKSPKKAP
jgi:putative SOS response-associated peptidase YedK